MLLIGQIIWLTTLLASQKETIATRLEQVAGVGDLAIVNSYYIGLLLSSSDSLDRNVGESVKVFFQIK